MGFGGACCTAAAVTTGSAAQQDNNIAVFRTFSAYIFRRSRTDNCTDFHSLSHIAIVVNFVYLTCCQTDLVAVRAVTSSSCGNDFSLRQFALECFGNGCQRVACTCYTHRSVYIGTTAQRVTDSTAYAGCSAAERFDFCGMVVCFVFEQQQPFFHSIFHFYVDFDCASVDFFGFIQFVQLALLFQEFCHDSTHIHQVDGFCSADGFSCFQIFVISALQQCVFEFHAVDGCQECGMTAVIRPVCINHFDFCDGRISVFALEIRLTYFDVVQIHCQTLICYKLCQCSFVHFAETVQCCHGSRNVIYHFQCICFCQSSFSGFHRVDNIFLDSFHIRVAQITVQQVNFRALYQRSVLFGNNLDTFCCGVCSLVELTGQKFHCEHFRAVLRDFCQQVIQLRFGKYRCFAVFKQFFVNVFYVVTIQKAQTCQTFDAQQVHQISSQAVCFCLQTLFFLHINSINHRCYTSAARAFLPISFR